AVVLALRVNRWSELLRRHLASCPGCSEALWAGRLLLEEARSAEGEASLPDPRRIWLDARLRARGLSLARATRFIALVQRIALVCALALAALGTAWLLPHLGRWLDRIRPPVLALGSGLAFVNGIMLVFACGCFVVLAGYALFIAWRDES
ncbi:MAG: hypothetical protein V1750_08675, partial [Acidobacteriota bacterium]